MKPLLVALLFNLSFWFWWTMLNVVILAVTGRTVGMF